MISPPNSTELTSCTKPDPSSLELPGSAIDSVPPPPRKTRRNHSEIERRRRQKLNAKYDELRELMPNCKAFRFAKRGGDAGLHKLDILTEAVEYIRELQGGKDENIPQKTAATQISEVSGGSHALNGQRTIPPVVQPPGQKPAPKHNISFLCN